MSNEERDTELGRLLNEAPAPDYDPGFMEHLEATLAEEANHQRPFIVRHWGASAITTVAAAAVAGVVAVGVVPAKVFEAAQDASPAVTSTTMAPAPQLDLAAQVSAAVADTIETASALSGRMENRYFDDNGQEVGDGFTTAYFLLSADGSYRYKVSGGERSEAYDEAFNAKTGVVERSTGMTQSKEAPDAPEYFDTYFAVAKSLSQAGTADARYGTFEGKDVVVIDASGFPDAEFWEYNRVEVMVDRQTNVPLRISYFHDKALLSEMTFRDVALNPAVSEDDFSLPLEAGTALRQEQSSWQRFSPNEPLPKLAYNPQYPKLPEGFVLSDIWLSTDTSVGQRDQLQLIYRNGLQTVTVTEVTADSDLFGLDGRGEDYTVPSGSFQGVVARVSNTPAHSAAEVRGATTSLLISGSLGPQDLRNALVMSTTR